MATSSPKRKRKDEEMGVDKQSIEETNTEPDDSIANEFPEHKGPKTLQWHRDNYPPVDSTSKSFDSTSQIVYLICNRVGLTSLKRWKKLSKQQRSWFIRTCCRFADVYSVEFSRILVYDVTMHVFSVFKTKNADKIAELQSDECAVFVSQWWSKYMDQCVKVPEAIIFPQRAPAPVVPVVDNAVNNDRAIDRASRHHYIPSSSDADDGSGNDDIAQQEDDSDDNMTLGTFKAENMTVGQLRSKTKQQNSATPRKKTPKSKTSTCKKKSAKEEKYADSPSKRTRASCRGISFKHQSSDSEESADRDSGGEVFIDDFEADTLANEAAESTLKFAEQQFDTLYEPDDPCDNLCDLFHPKQTELQAYIRRYLQYHRVYKELAIREYNLWGKRAGLRSVYLGLNGGKGWEAGTAQMGVWGLKDKWNTKTAKSRRQKRTVFYKPQ